MKKKLLVFLFLSLFSLNYATTLVYNLRIRRVFSGLDNFLRAKKRALLPVTAVPIIYRRTGQFVNEQRNTSVYEKRHGGGSILNVRCIPSKYWWLEATTAIQKESVCAQGTSNFEASRSGFDDIVISAGSNFFPSDSSQITIYGLTGIPTRYKLIPEEAQDRLVGTRLYSLGAGIEGSYSFIKTDKELLAGIIQVRTIHFFSRSFEPLLPPGSIFQPGQVTDILLSIRYRKNRTLFEAGYNPTVFTNQALILPTETLNTKTAVRHGTYGSIIHLTKKRIFGKRVALGAGFFFNRLVRLDATNISGWLSITLII